jgi:hypothetical protein
VGNQESYASAGNWQSVFARKENQKGPLCLRALELPSGAPGIEPRHIASKVTGIGYKRTRRPSTFLLAGGRACRRKQQTRRMHAPRNISFQHIPPRQSTHTKAMRFDSNFPAMCNERPTNNGPVTTISQPNQTAFNSHSVGLFPGNGLLVDAAFATAAHSQVGVAMKNFSISRLPRTHCGRVERPYVPVLSERRENRPKRGVRAQRTGQQAGRWRRLGFREL